MRTIAKKAKVIIDKALSFEGMEMKEWLDENSTYKSEEVVMIVTYCRRLLRHLNILFRLLSPARSRNPKARVIGADKSF